MNREEILSLLPEMNQIKDESLREKVVKVWQVDRSGIEVHSLHPPGG